MKKLYTAAPLLAAITFVGCSYEKPLRSTENPVEFRASINPTTRANGTSWETSDEIGIFMLPGDGSNVKHIHTGEGFFSADDQPLYYPKDGSAVDFVAYYPYSEEIDESLYPIDITDQSEPAEIDFMYSNNAENYTSGVPFLQFHHQLARLVLSITAAEDDSLEGLAGTIKGLKTAGTYNLSTGTLSRTNDSEADIEMRIVSTTEQVVTLEAIVLPESDLDFTIDFTFIDGSTATLPMTDVAYSKGYAYTYNVSISAQAKAVVIDNTDIVGWIDGGSSDHEIEKKPNGSGTGESEVYYLETFGTDNVYASKPTLEAFTGWSSGVAGVSYVNSGSTAVNIRSQSATPTNPYMCFPPQVVSDLSIEELPASYSDIVFSCELFCSSGSLSNPVRFFANGTEVFTDSPSTLTGTPAHVSLELPDGTTSIRFVVDLTLSPTTTVNVDNIQLEGIAAD